MSSVVDGFVAVNHARTLAVVLPQIQSKQRERDRQRERARAKEEENVQSRQGKTEEKA